MSDVIFAAVLVTLVLVLMFAGERTVKKPVNLKAAVHEIYRPFSPQK